MSTHAEFEYLIIGAGPAGLQLGYYLEEAGLSYLILEAGDSPGTFFKVFPRHRRLLSINKIYTGYDENEINLRWDWNSLLSDRDHLPFGQYSARYFPDADDLVKYLEDYAARFDLKMRCRVTVTRIWRDNGFQVRDAEGHVYTCRRLIVATGVSKPYVPPIPGIELAENYTGVSVDAKEFTNQRVLIIGKGNSAFETADNLVATAAAIHLVSPTSVTMAWRTHFVGHLRAVNNNILDTYQLKSQNAILDATVHKIERRNGKLAVTVAYRHANGEVEELLYDRVIACTGFRFDDSIFDPACRPALTITDRFPHQTSEWESTNVQDLYFAGTLMQARDYKKTTSAFIHGFRYNIRALFRILQHKYHHQPWPSRTIRASAEGLTEAVIQRVNSSSGLWQQFGLLSDVIEVSDDGREARYYEELPVDYVHDREFGQRHQYYLITLEYGPDHAFHDPFNVQRIERHDVQQAQRSNFLHPVVRHYTGSELISEHHIIEDLAAEWLEDVHIQPLMKYFDTELTQCRESKDWTRPCEAEYLDRVQAATPLAITG
jgi:thioredoxin reductase